MGKYDDDFLYDEEDLDEFDFEVEKTLRRLHKSNQNQKKAKKKEKE